MSSIIRPEATLLGEDNRRARELFRYVDPASLVFRSGKQYEEPQSPLPPPQSPIPHATTPSLSSALKPFVQFSALRCHAQRAFISVVSDTHQYFLSEASRVLDVSNEENWERDEELLWLGCGGVEKEGKLCEMTMQLPPAAPGQHAFYVLSDLPSHPIYGKLPFVTGDPYFRFYAGTPLTTKNGIRIGSLCIMDTKNRGDLTPDMKNFLGEMADQVMAYLEINRDALEGRRSRLMSDALNHFVQGKSSVRAPSSGSLQQPAANIRINPQEGLDERRESPGESHRQPSISSPTQIGKDSGSAVEETASGEATDSNTRSSRLPEEADESRSHPWTLARAANLLREALEVDGDGGVLFIEASNRTNSQPMRSQDAAVIETDTSGTDEGSHAKDILAPVRRSTTESQPQNSLSRVNTLPSWSRSTFCRVQASSTEDVPLALPDNPINVSKFSHVDPDFLRELLQHYPRGKLWVFDADGSLMSSDDDRYASRKSIDAGVGKRSRRGRRKKVEAERLQKLFPGSRQLIFAPLWDASIGKWYSGCFCWSSSDHRTYSSPRELGFTMSFTKSVIAECNRLDTLISDKQKGDFIGSVSHELRSPLHGILASAEFLLDTEMSAFQKSLVDTIEACGRTLLDTINHVLDYSKIASFERTYRDTKDRRGATAESSIIPSPGHQLPTAAPPLLRLYAQTDIAAIAEEVVEGLVVARSYVQSPDLTDVSAAAKVRRDSRTPDSRGGLHGRETPTSTDKDDHVEVLLDIQKGDWRFVTQPGALRRVIMNLVGNSLKYTARGSIRVRLRQQAPQADENNENHDRSNIVLTVSDTGKGISPEYLHSKLFVPFAQEDSLTPGTGLGLSIVRSITTMLGGTIDVRSTVGKGTTVTMSLPVLRPRAASVSDSSNPPSDSTVASVEELISPLRDLGEGKTVSIFQASSQAGVIPEEWKTAASSYITEWFGFQMSPWDGKQPSNLVVVEEHDLAELSSTLSNRDDHHHLGIVVLCKNATQHGQARHDTSLLSSSQVLERVTLNPLGPYKLARALRACLERLDIARTLQSGHSLEQSPSPVPDKLVSTDLSERMQEMELESTDRSGRPFVVQTNETISVKETSRNAQMALNSPLNEGPADSPSPGREYPFPDTSPSPERERSSRKRKPSAFRSLSTEMATGPSTPSEDVRGRDPIAKENLGTVSEGETAKKLYDPKVLLVDDNAINLRLLQTFMNKRKYSLVSSAENGAIAVDAVKSAGGYDIIFMDVSMPVLDGFKATRAIREWEAENGIRKPAMIIALTGLASGRDQSEAFASGMDIYLCKPISFKEVSKLLDNFEINKTAAA